MPTLLLANVARGRPQPWGRGSDVRSRNSPPCILKGPPALVLVRRTDGRMDVRTRWDGKSRRRGAVLGRALGRTLGGSAVSHAAGEPRAPPRQRATAIPEALCLTLRRHAPRRYSCLTARPGHAENLGLHSHFYCVQVRAPWLTTSGSQP